MKPLLLFIALFWSCSLFSQDVVVKVRSGDYPLGFAYLQINRHLVCSADSLGIATIPTEQIQKGDTITASYLTEEKSVIYQPNAQNEIEINIETDLLLPAATISAKDRSWQYFRKYVKQAHGLLWWSKYFVDFKVVVGQDTVSRGSFKYQQIPENNFAIRNDVFKFDKKSDKTFESLLKMAFLYQLNLSSPYQNIHGIKSNLKCRYAGKRDGEHIFYFTIPWTKKGEHYQTILKSNEKTKKIVSVEGVHKSEYINLTATCAYTYYKGIIYPSYSICEYKNGPSFLKIIFNTRFEFSYENKRFI